MGWQWRYGCVGPALSAGEHLKVLCYVPDRKPLTGTLGVVAWGHLTEGRCRMPRLTLAVVAMIAVLALLSSCNDDAPEEPESGNPEGAGGPGAPLETPRRITEGDAVPSEAFDVPTEDHGAIEPMHVGDIVNGIEILAPGENAQGICPREQIVSDQEIPFELEYLPENTHEIVEPRVLECPDGRLESASRRFLIGISPAGFNVSYARLAGPAAASGTGPVEPIEINGVDGVLVGAQRTEEGSALSQTQIVVPTDEGGLAITANGVPTDEVIAIAEGIRCFEC